MLHADECAGLRRRQRPDNDALQPQSVPGVGQLPIRFDH